MEALLRIFEKLQELDFGKLMAIYGESNAENAEEFYPDDPQNLAIMKVEQDFYRYLKEDFFRHEGVFYAVWEAGGAYVSALRMEPYKDGLLLEALETEPSCRKHGHAKQLIRSVCSYLAERGAARIYSHVSKKNVASLQTHLSCGFCRVEEYATYIDGSVTQRSCTMRLQIEPQIKP